MDLKHCLVYIVWSNLAETDKIQWPNSSVALLGMFKYYGSKKIMKQHEKCFTMIIM
jgi:hypothetical protein